MKKPSNLKILLQRWSKLSLVAIASFAPILATAAETDPERDRFIAIFEQHGCVLSQKDAPLVLGGNGISKQESRVIVEELMGAGQAFLEGSDLRLSPEICTSQDPSDQSNAEAVKSILDKHAQFLKLVQENGCKMSEDDAEAILPPHGISMEEAEDIFGSWLASGQAKFEFEGDVLMLGDELCAGNQKVAISRPAFSDVELEVLTAIRANGCRITEQEADELLPELGISKEDTAEIMDRWQKTDIVSFEGPHAVLATDLCSAHGIDENDTQARSAAFVGIIEANGCTMNENLASVILPEAGFEKDEVRDIVGQLVESGMVQIEGKTLKLISENCAS